MPPEILDLGPLAGTVVVVLLFLKYLTGHREHDKQRDIDHSARTKEIVEDMRVDSQTRKDEVISCVKDNTIALGENSKIIGGATVVLGQAAEVIRKIDDRKAQGE